MQSGAKVGVLLAVAAVTVSGWETIHGGEAGRCPGLLHGTPPVGQRAPIPISPEVYNAELKKLKVEEVLDDIVDLLTQSQSCWPADTFATSTIGESYGGLFVRLAWHCSGSFRSTDRKGGCGGGRMRFPPESSWEDNTNLDKARALLWPIKEKYGDGLSWGDLFVLAGTGSILHMGGPVTEVCVGRVDDEDGSASAPLGGPGVAQQPHCPVQGECPSPLGSSTVGLIYVNPEGFRGRPEPESTAAHIREVFSRMGMNDSETVALIGGGHAFGKSHGVCPAGAGAPPIEDPHNPWPGNCGGGRGAETTTSGIEGPWTTDPFRWDNEFFQLLDTYGGEYTFWRGPGGKYQWRINQKPLLMMLTTDVALYYDQTYRELVREYAADITKLDRSFANAWAKLTTNGGVWAAEKKCLKPHTSRYVHSGLDAQRTCTYNSKLYRHGAYADHGEERCQCNYGQWSQCKPVYKQCTFNDNMYDTGMWVTTGDRLRCYCFDGVWEDCTSVVSAKCAYSGRYYTHGEWVYKKDEGKTCKCSNSTWTECNTYPSCEYKGVWTPHGQWARTDKRKCCKCSASQWRGC